MIMSIYRVITVKFYIYMPFKLPLSLIAINRP